MDFQIFPPSAPGYHLVDRDETRGGDDEDQDGGEEADAEHPGLFQPEQAGILLNVRRNVLRPPNPAHKNAHADAADGHEVVVGEDAHCILSFAANVISSSVFL